MVYTTSYSILEYRIGREHTVVICLSFHGLHIYRSLALHKTG